MVSALSFEEHVSATSFRPKNFCGESKQSRLMVPVVFE